MIATWFLTLCILQATAALLNCLAVFKFRIPKKLRSAIPHGIYASQDLMKWFTDEWAKRDLGKLDMGKELHKI